MGFTKIGSYNFLAEPFHVDFTGHLTLGVIGNHMLNCAGMHADQRGFGISSLNKHNCTWVLSRIVCEFDEYPYQYDTFTIETWVEAVFKLFTKRNFSLIDKNGKVIGYAKSIWAMIDLNTRKPVDLYSIQDASIADYAVPEKTCPIADPSRIKVTTAEPIASLDAKYSDIDINGHFNSVRYIEHILDLFPLTMFSEKHLHRFEIAFVNESHYGDTLDYYLDKIDGNKYNVEIKNQASAEVICRSSVEFI